MIHLRLKADFETRTTPFVVKLRVQHRQNSSILADHEAIASPRLEHAGTYDCRYHGGAFTLYAMPEDSIDGDVVLCVPSRSGVQRLFRRASKHNTLLLTERCDQLCVMCSQPPRDINDSWRFPLYEHALLLADPGAVVGISGGEPTLFKDALIGMIERVAERRPDLSYHILSNGQHFSEADRPALTRLHDRIPIVWGVPLYSHREEAHDEIVGKAGAYQRLINNLLLLGSANTRIELRTVITALNVLDLPHLATFVANNLPFVCDWAIMGMEPIGYARANWKKLFFDHSVFPQPVINAIEISALRRVPCHLYNIPRCTVPEGYRSYCVDSISDWKKKYLPACDRCIEKPRCPGFFEWYNAATAWSGIKPIEAGGTIQ